MEYSALVEKGKVTAEARDEALSRIHTTTALEDLASADLVIEAITEEIDLKTELFQKTFQFERNKIVATNPVLLA